MSDNRRDFLKKSVGIGALATIGGGFNYLNAYGAGTEFPIIEGEKVKIDPSPPGMIFKPLDSITVTGIPECTISILDGEGRVYIKEKAEGTFSFKAGGSLGNQLILLLDKKDRILDVASFRIDCQTEINDEKGKYGELLKVLYWTLISSTESYKTRRVTKVRLNDKIYSFFWFWLRDHTHTMKGMKYFSPDLKSAIELYADSQREDGMIWDRITKRSYQKSFWEDPFTDGGFQRSVEGGKYEFTRVPVENDVEYLFIEAIYYTWKATGDSHWMAGLLDKALKAVEYSTNDIYRWSEKYKLLKRGYTIDTWDFQSQEDVEISGHIMVVHPEKSRFGVMFGDNTGMAAACGYLAEMLKFTGRTEESEKIDELGASLRRRLDKLSWNGKYYTHHVPEDPLVKRDLGVDEKSQVSLSNAYSLNRGLEHEKCVAIIKTYKAIREEMPPSSPGEWYTIYPPFEKGFGKRDSSGKWEYMNAGVTPIVAGELAHGAFEHGFEAYGADILMRIGKLAEKTDNYLHCAYRGAMPEVPQRVFTPVSLVKIANRVYPPKEAKHDGKVYGYGAEQGVLSFHDISFEFLNPDKEPLTGISLSSREGETAGVSSVVNQKAASVYFLHSRDGGPIAGTVTLRYEDGTEYIDYITADKAGNWWSQKETGNCKLGWRSNNRGQYIELSVYGMNNPHPEKVIVSIDINANGSRSFWHITAITICDSPVFFMPSIISHGIPDNWGSGAVVYALIEGLAGVKDEGVAFDKALIAPRWEAAGVNKASASIKYEASGAYVSYSYEKDKAGNNLNLILTGNCSEAEVEILLPADKEPRSLILNGKSTVSSIKQVEDSKYLCLGISGVGVNELKIEMN